MKIENYTAEGKKWRCKVQGIVFDAGTNKWTGSALWRTNGGFEKADIEAPTYGGLVDAAKAVLTPAP